MRAGQIVEHGSQTGLLERHGFYDDLYSSQFRAYPGTRLGHHLALTGTGRAATVPIRLELDVEAFGWVVALEPRRLRWEEYRCASYVRFVHIRYRRVAQGATLRAAAGLLRRRLYPPCLDTDTFVPDHVTALVMD